MNFSFPSRRASLGILSSFLLAAFFLFYVCLAEDADITISRDLSSVAPLSLLKESWLAGDSRPMAPPPSVDVLSKVERLDAKHIPMAGNGRRIVIVGDVHGCYKPLHRLLKKIKFRGLRTREYDDEDIEDDEAPDGDELTSAFDDMSLGHSRNTDHLILAGDMINKGPSSAKVIDLAMRLGASAVRGNHEDSVLRERAALDVARDSEQQVLASNLPRADSVERQTAASLSHAHVAWLSALPVILDLGSVQGFPSAGRIAVTHAGLLPSVPLKSQDPWVAMHVRTLTYPREERRREKALAALLDDAVASFRKTTEYRSHPDDWPAKRLRKTLRARITDDDIEKEFRRRTKPSDRDVVVPSDDHGGEPWAVAWERAQRAIPEASERMVVVYGHDSKVGLREGPFTVGLDSGCVKGHRLSALVIEATDDGVRHEIVSVKCK